MIHRVKGFWEIQKNTYDIFSIFNSIREFIHKSD